MIFLRRKIKAKIKEIERKILNLNIEANKMKIEHKFSTRDYANYSVRLHDLKDDIKLLQSLL